MTMQIVVFGAARGTGRAVVEGGIAAGHRVTAVVRGDPRGLTPRPGVLEVEQGDATDPDRVAALVSGADALVSAVGASGRDKSGVRERATRAQLAGMRAAGVRRLISVSSLGIDDSAGALPWWMRTLLVPLFLGPAFRDHERQEAVLQEADDLDWTIVRPGGLTDGPPTGRYHHGFQRLPSGASGRIARADVADFILRELAEPAYLRSAVAVSG